MTKESHTGRPILGRVRRPGIARATTLLFLTISALVGAVLVAGSASAATRPVGHVDSITISASNVVSVSGWAYDQGSSTQSVRVHIWVDYRSVQETIADRARPDVNTAFHIKGNHGFATSYQLSGKPFQICAQAIHVVSGEPDTTIGCKYFNGPTPPAGARPVGHLDAFGLSSTTVTARGWTYDQGLPTRANRVQITADNTVLATVYTTVARSDINSAYHVIGTHGFSFSAAAPKAWSKICVRSLHLVANEPDTWLGCKYNNQGAKVIATAKTQVGRSYWTFGGSAPPGMDCSGYTMWTYATALGKSLPHNAESQRLMFKPISRAAARPGDLIFYGAPAYHVAIYAGGNLQYESTTAGNPISYSTIWSGNISFGTILH